jgi:hypothetical protein
MNLPCNQFQLGHGIGFCHSHMRQASPGALAAFFANPILQAAPPPAAHERTFAPKPINQDDAHVNVVRKIPATSFEKFAKIVHSITLKANDPTTTHDERLQIVHDFLNIPKAILKKGRGGYGAKKAYLDMQITGALRSPAVHVQQRSRTSTAEQLKENEERNNTLKERMRNMAAARDLIADGHVGRAMKLLHRIPAANDLTAEERVTEMIRLHPHEDECGRIPAAPSVISVTEKTLTQALQHACNGSALGRTGWSPDVMLQLYANDLTHDFMNTFFKLIINDEIDDSVRARIGGCNVSGIPKPGKRELRPIAVGESFNRVAGSYLIKSEADVIAAHFQPLQFGVSCKGGCEKIIHRVRRDLAEHCNAFIATIDFRNAFNSVLRRAFRAIITGDVKWTFLHNAFNAGYACASQMHYRVDKEGRVELITSSRGSRQGDPLGGLFFCIALHPILVAAASRFPTLRIYAYMDDITITGTDAAAYKECFEYIERQAKDIGLEVHRGKCEFFSNQALPKDMPGIKYRNRKAGELIRVLGAHLGNESAVVQHLKKECELLERLFENVVEMGGHEALIGLSMTLAPMAGFIMRTHPPAETREYAAQFDKLCCETLAELGEFHLTKQVRLQIQLPTALGGMGLINTHDTAEIAYASSQLESLAGSDAERKNVKHQHERLEEYNTNLLAQLKRDPAMARHLEDTAQKGTADFMRWIADGADAQQPHVLGAMIRLRLATPHRSLIGTVPQCPGCKTQCTGANFSEHVSSCVLIPGHNATRAHNAWRDAVKRIAYVLGLHSDAGEPRHLRHAKCPACKTRFGEERIDEHVRTCSAGVTRQALEEVHVSGPDATFHPFGQKPIVVDFSFISHLLRGGRSTAVSETFAAREGEKEDMYGEEVREGGSEFAVPVATRNGGLNNGCVTLATAIAAQLNSNVKHVIRQIRYAAQDASARSLLNAERAAGVVHRHVARDKESASNWSQHETGEESRQDIAAILLVGAAKNREDKPKCTPDPLPTPIEHVVENAAAWGAMLLYPPSSTCELPTAPAAPEQDANELLTRNIMTLTIGCVTNGLPPVLPLPPWAATLVTVLAGCWNFAPNVIPRRWLPWQRDAPRTTTATHARLNKTLAVVGSVAGGILLQPQLFMETVRSVKFEIVICLIAATRCLWVACTAHPMAHANSNASDGETDADTRFSWRATVFSPAAELCRDLFVEAKTFLHTPHNTQHRKKHIAAAVCRALTYTLRCVGVLYHAAFIPHWCIQTWCVFRGQLWTAVMISAGFEKETSGYVTPWNALLATVQLAFFIATSTVGGIRDLVQWAGPLVTGYVTAAVVTLCATAWLLHRFGVLKPTCVVTAIATRWMILAFLTMFVALCGCVAFMVPAMLNAAATVAASPTAMVALQPALTAAGVITAPTWTSAVVTFAAKVGTEALNGMALGRGAFAAVGGAVFTVATTGGAGSNAVRVNG